MGLDVYLEDSNVITVQNSCHCCGNVTTQKLQKEYFHEKITHNLAKMAAECGLYEPIWRPEENEIETASQMIPFLREGIRILQEEHVSYLRYEPDTGFGTYDYLLKFCRMYLEACEKFPLSKVRVER